MTIAIIPARGGSKGIPRKNTRTMLGVPLVARAINVCHEAGVSPVVSTEDSEIADIADYHDAEVVHRPRQLASDTTPSQLVLQHVLKRKQISRREVVAFVQCTAPFMTASDVRGVVGAAGGGECDLAVAVHEDAVFTISRDGKAEFDVPVGRRQDVWRYVVSGSCWAARAGYWLSKDFYSGKIAPVVSENPLRLDIDEQHDWDVAESVLWRQHSTV